MPAPVMQDGLCWTCGPGATKAEEVGVAVGRAIADAYIAGLKQMCDANAPGPLGREQARLQRTPGHTADCECRGCGGRIGG